MSLTVYILAKDERANIRRCLAALKAAGPPVVVLDSQSSDDTRQIARELGATVENFRYTTHLEALNYITAERTSRTSYAMVLDADMVVSEGLLREAVALLEEGTANVVCAPVRMYWESHVLERGSLYPPKPFVFRGGAAYFVEAGHGEKLRNDVVPAQTCETLVHDDRKPFERYVMSQFRYSATLQQRMAAGALTWKDRFRIRSPFLMMIAVPLYSFIFRGGFLSGKAGIGYALDRLIAEAIKYRDMLTKEMNGKAELETEASSRAIAGKER